MQIKPILLLLLNLVFATGYIDIAPFVQQVLSSAAEHIYDVDETANADLDVDRQCIFFKMAILIGGPNWLEHDNKNRTHLVELWSKCGTKDAAKNNATEKKFDALINSEIDKYVCRGMVNEMRKGAWELQNWHKALDKFGFFAKKLMQQCEEKLDKEDEMLKQMFTFANDVLKCMDGGNKTTDVLECKGGSNKTTDVLECKGDGSNKTTLKSANECQIKVQEAMDTKRTWMIVAIFFIVAFILASIGLVVVMAFFMVRRKKMIKF